jgi:transcription initiation factor IIE alpha subunit
MRQIATATKMNDLEIRRIVYGLLEAGLVETVRIDDGSAQVSSARVFPSQNKEEQKSLINRLITRIRSL